MVSYQLSDNCAVIYKTCLSKIERNGVYLENHAHGLPVAYETTVVQLRTDEYIRILIHG